MRGDHSIAHAQRLAESLRDRLPRLQIVVHGGGGSFKSQMRKADRSGASLALILGESEMAAGTVAVKHLRRDQPQEEISQADLVARLEPMLEQ